MLPGLSTTMKPFSSSLCSILTGVDAIGGSCLCRIFLNMGTLVRLGPGYVEASSTSPLKIIPVFDYCAWSSHFAIDSRDTTFKGKPLGLKVSSTIDRRKNSNGTYIIFHTTVSKLCRYHFKYFPTIPAFFGPCSEGMPVRCQFSESRLSFERAVYFWYGRWCYQGWDIPDGRR